MINWWDLSLPEIWNLNMETSLRTNLPTYRDNTSVSRVTETLTAVVSIPKSGQFDKPRSVMDSITSVTNRHDSRKSRARRNLLKKNAIDNIINWNIVHRGSFSQRQYYYYHFLLIVDSKLFRYGLTNPYTDKVC